jgi:protein FRG1
MVKPLVFKGDKKKKRKREAPEAGEGSTPHEGGKRVATGAGAAAATTTTTTDDDDSWVSADAVSDVAGPVLLVLPTSPPASLACDANGSVFAMTVENIVDDNPASAEPHDVRQVWVAIRVGDVFQFKGHHGKSVFSKMPQATLSGTTR